MLGLVFKVTKLFLLATGCLTIALVVTDELGQANPQERELLTQKVKEAIETEEITQWEYRCLDQSGDNVNFLNDLGSSGWELAAVYDQGKSWCFKRER